MTFIQILYAGLIVLSALQIVQALRSGKVGYLLGTQRRTRADDPLAFWGVILFWLVVIGYLAFRISTL
ncbi:MAG: hypothetical protein GW855_13615 [Erythrobacter sp.]|nr:hypothetical protein [Erythrobacter sp.]NCQ62898.1 hypothetical protein [Alphaproteobacteria bacterium]